MSDDQKNEGPTCDYSNLFEDTHVQADAHKRVFDDATLANMRGMSEPFFFTFSVISPKSKVLLSHAVIFTSFVLQESDKIKLCDTSDDPRMEAFVRYIWHNFLNKKKADFKKQLEKIEQEIRAQIEIDRKEIKKLQQKR